LLGFEKLNIDRPGLGFSSKRLDIAQAVADPAWVGSFENIRWSVDRAADDWRPTGTPNDAERDDEARRRTQMNYVGREYSKLPKDQKDIDTRQFDAVLDELRAPSDGHGTVTYLAPGPTVNAYWATDDGLKLKLADKAAL